MSGKSGLRTLTAIFGVVRDPSVSDRAFRLWVAYRSYDTDAGAFCGDERMASHLGCSERTLRRHRAKLIESGHLRQKLDGPNPARYWAVVPERPAKSVPPSNADDRPNLSPLRPAKSVPPKTDDRTNDRTDDRPNMSGDNYSKDMQTKAPAVPSTVLSTERTTKTVPSLRSGTGAPQGGAPAKRAPVGGGTDRCSGCGGPRDGPGLSRCLRCHRAAAGLPAIACQGEAEADYTPGEKGLVAVCPSCGGGMAADAERCETCRSVPAELSPQ